jgi:ACS family glucarate transporter-like MFS transporter
MREPAATRSRFILLRLSLALSIITFLDRVAISSAALAIRGELHLTVVQIGWVFSAFTFAYAAFEIPSGWLGDVIGPRKVLARIVLWWSAFTAATGLAWNFTSLIAARFLFGLGEAGAFPNISRSFAQWFPQRERGSAHGVVFMGTRLGGAIAPPIVAWLMGWFGWRQSFFVFGAIGVIWCVFWLRWFRDDPATHPSVNAEELETIQKGIAHQEKHAFRWSELLSVNLLFICLMYFCNGYTLYFNLTWLPTYLREARGFSIQQAGNIAGVVLLTGAVMTATGGWLTDRLVKRYGLKIGRSIGVVTLPLSGLVLLAAARAQDPLSAALLLAVTLGIADLNTSACWAICHDVGGENAGTVTACMNTFGNIGGALSPLVVGYAVEWWHSWSVPFFITAGVYVFGGVMTFLVNPNQRLMHSQKTPATPAAQTIAARP